MAWKDSQGREEIVPGDWFLGEAAPLPPRRRRPIEEVDVDDEDQTLQEGESDE